MGVNIENAKNKGEKNNSKIGYLKNQQGKRIIGFSGLIEV